MAAHAERGEPPRPPSSGSSITNVAPTVSPPERAMSLAAASAVPPCDRVVDDQDALAAGDGVLVHLDRIDAVLERCPAPGRSSSRQPPLLADRHEPTAEPVGDGAAEDEARASMPATASRGVARNGSAMRAIAALKPCASPSSVVMSRNMMPGLG